jgi:pimeloyl-ACP methyl ester carboxylesterase
MPYLEFENKGVYFETFGTGPAVVLLHGFLENSEMWRAWIPELSQKYQLVTIDLCGHGKTDSFLTPPSIATMAEAVYAVLKKIGVVKFVLVGHSMGGYVSVEVLNRYPNNVAGLCFFHSTAMADSEEKQENRERAIKVVKANKQTFIQAAIPMLFSEPNREHCKKEIAIATKQAQITNKSGVIYSLTAMKNRLDHRKLIEKQSSKVCYILGDSDPVLPLPAMLPESKLVIKDNWIVLKDCGHMSHLEKPTLALKSLSGVIEKLVLPV